MSALGCKFPSDRSVRRLATEGYCHVATRAGNLPCLGAGRMGSKKPGSRPRLTSLCGTAGTAIPHKGMKTRELHLHRPRSGIGGLGSTPAPERSCSRCTDTAHRSPTDIGCFAPLAKGQKGLRALQTAAGHRPGPGAAGDRWGRLEGRDVSAWWFQPGQTRRRCTGPLRSAGR